MSTTQPIVFITGANRGLAYEAAAQLAATNHHVIIGTRTLSNGREAIRKLTTERSIPASALSTVQIDVSDDDSIAAAAEQVRSEHGKIDILVNNSGVMVQPTGGVTGDDNLRSQWRHVFETNVFGHAVVTKAFTPLLQKSDFKGKRVVYVSSGLGSIDGALGSRGNLKFPIFSGESIPADIYRTSKAAVNMLMAIQSWTLAKEVPGLQTCVVDPGYCATEFNGMSGYRTAKEGGEAFALACTQEDVNGKFLSTEKECAPNGELPW